MALSVPSRFACLKIEDDDFRPPTQPKSKEKKKVEPKTNNKKLEKNGTVKKPPSQPQQQQSQSQTKKERKRKETTEQWDEWKEKDHELQKGSYEQDLQNALLLSMVDYEQKKKVYKQYMKESEQEKKGGDAQKKKKNKAMSLEQFNSMVTNNGKPGTKATNGECSYTDNEQSDKFFERIKSEAKEELSKELKREQNKDKNESKKVRKSFNDETITISQYQAKLEVQQQEISVLKAELEKARKEIFAVKTRNKTLCGILAQGEMKDKADVLVELVELSRVRDELTEEVTRLHGLLEQERSKVGALTVEPHSHNKHTKEKNRKKNESK